MIKRELDGNWVPKRRGIVNHYKGMNLSDIALFDLYLLSADQKTWTTYLSIDDIANRLPMSRRTAVRAKQRLVKMGWIRPVGKSGVFIEKMYKFAKTQSAKETPQGAKKELLSDKEELLVALKDLFDSAIKELKSAKEELQGAKEELKSARCAPIQEEYLYQEENIEERVIKDERWPERYRDWKLR